MFFGRTHARNTEKDRKMATATGTEWQLARQWLLDARVIPPSHPATKPSAQLIDFANCLRDGVYLCALLNKLVPNTVANYHPRATLPVSVQRKAASFFPEGGSFLLLRGTRALCLLKFLERTVCSPYCCDRLDCLPFAMGTSGAHLL